MTDVSLADAARVLEDFASRTLPAVGVEAQREVTAYVAEQEVLHAPVGSEVDGMLGIRRLRADPHPGLSRASIRTSVDEPVGAGLASAGGGYPIPGPAELDAPLAGLTLGRTTYVTDDASERGFVYAWPVDVVGRSTDSLGRPSGSEQAPEGVARPAVDYAEAEWPAIVARAVAKAGGAK